MQSREDGKSDVETICHSRFTNDAREAALTFIMQQLKGLHGP